MENISSTLSQSSMYSHLLSSWKTSISTQTEKGISISQDFEESEISQEQQVVDNIDDVKSIMNFNWNSFELNNKYPNDFNLEIQNKIFNTLRNIKLHPNNPNRLISANVIPKYYIQTDPCLKIVYLSNIKINKGGFGSIKEAYALSDSENLVWKVAHSYSSACDVKKLNRELKNEYEKLSFIHHDEQIPGIQRKPDALFCLKTGQLAYIAPKYQVDLLNVLNDKNHEYTRLLRSNVTFAMEQFAQLLNALGHLEKLGIIHKDIKPENIFIYKDHEGIWKTHLGDFGSAQFVDTLSNASIDELMGTWTPLYSSKIYRLAAFEEHRKKNLEKFYKHLFQNDIFALGICFYAALTGSLPYNFTLYNFDLDKPVDPKGVFLNHVPQALKNFVYDMIDGKDLEAPTPLKWCERFSRIQEYILSNNLNTATSLPIVNSAST